MAGLVSDAQLQSLQKLVLTGMVTPVEILRRTVVDDAYSDDSAISFVSQGTANAWVRHQPGGVLQVVGAVTGNVSPLRLLFPLGTDIRNGDRLAFTTSSGDVEDFVVQDTNQESTYKTHLWVEVRHLD